MSDFETKTEDNGRQLVRELLEQCTEPQQKFFERCFPGGINGLKGDKIKHAYDLCQRTLKANLEEKVPS